MINKHDGKITGFQAEITFHEYPLKVFELYVEIRKSVVEMVIQHENDETLFKVLASAIEDGYTSMVVHGEKFLINDINWGVEDLNRLVITASIMRPAEAYINEHYKVTIL